MKRTVILTYVKTKVTSTVKTGNIGVENQVKDLVSSTNYVKITDLLIH